MKTDTQLQYDVMAELKWEPSVRAAEIGVLVRDGVVTLAGHVSSYREKLDAEQAALRVAGVAALATEIEVTLSEFGRRDDADVARSAETALGWLAYPSNIRIKVMVERGWITLSGSADWQYQKQAASDAVRHIVGVTGVSNQIAVQPEASSGNLKADIEAALQRRAHHDAMQICVDVDGADVTLSGSVGSWVAREQARQAAWGTGGVRNVVDNLTVLR